MEENNKAHELALKMADLFQGHSPIDVLEAVSNTYCAVVNSQILTPMARILAYSEFIKRLNERISEISVDLLSATSNNTNTL